MYWGRQQQQQPTRFWGGSRLAEWGPWR
uniref:Uncharacterized protein n=1 Tax=Arundo donax TaxID=35708 RepID=A0A0A9BU55_ARUDO